MEINELKAARFKFLHHLYKLTGGNEMNWYEEAEIGQEIGFDKSLIDLVGQYLKNEGLIEYHASGPMIGITHNGVIEVEDALMNPDQPTQYFPPVVNIINVHHMEGSQIQQGTVMLFTRWLYPLRKPIPLSNSPCFVLDYPRGAEIANVAELLDESYPVA